MHHITNEPAYNNNIFCFLNDGGGNMFKSLVIAPYLGMKDLFEDMAETVPYEIHVEVGDLNKGLTIAKGAEQQGYDVIISRGGTARLIRKHVQIPVIEITVNGYDILRLLTFVKGFQGKIGIIGFANIVDGVDTIAELLDMHVMKFTIQHEHEAENAIEKAKEHGVGLVIGDVVTVGKAESSGLRALLITSGREAIAEALERAKEKVLSNRKQHQEMIVMKSVLNAMEHGVISVNSEGEVIFCNIMAARLFGVNEHQAIGMKWRQLTEQIQFQEESRLPEAFARVIPRGVDKGKTAVIIGRPAVSGGMNYMIFPSEQIKLLEREIRKTEEEGISLPRGQFQQFVRTDFINDAYMDKAEQWSKLSEPILIVGESGTGKRSVAEAIHNESDFREGPFVTFHARLVPKDQHESFLFGAAERESSLIRRAQGGTLYIHHIEELSLPEQRKLAAILNAPGENAGVSNEDTAAFRFIASTSVDLDQQVKIGQFDQQLYSFLRIYTLLLPPLRAFIDDLDHLIFWHLAEMNRSLGKQVLGVKPDVIKMLKTYGWPGNMPELKRVLKLMIETCDGSFVSLQQAEPILTSFFHHASASGNHTLEQLLGVDRTLDEIEQDIIQIVLEQEGFNQSVAAKRLGINRTTLWRRLNKE
jgi:transcriptional regulator with PAS, ATPase and Fis domain